MNKGVRPKAVLFFCFFSVMFLSMVLGSALVVARTLNPSVDPSARDYIAALEAINMDELKAHVEAFSGFGTRFTGYPGCERAASYITSQFESYGIGTIPGSRIEYHRFDAVVPVDEGAYLLLPTGENMTLYPLFPNLVCPPQTPFGGLSGDLIYVGDGEIAEFNGKRVEGSIVLMNFNTQYRWLTAAKMGAKAVIFIEPPETSMMEAKMKALELVAYNFPRLYVKAEDAQRLMGLEGARVKLVSNMKWKQVTAKNILAYLPGDPEFADKYVLITASYDSFSIIPSLAPGAHEAIGISIVLQLAKYFATHPGSHKYTLVFIAFSGTNQGVIGSRWFVKEYVDENWETWGKKLALQMNFDINDVNRLIMPTIVMGWLWGWSEGTAPWVEKYHKWLFETMVPDMAEKLGMPELKFDAQLGRGRVVREMFGAGGPGHGIVWSDQLGAPYRYGDNEPLALIGGPGFSWHNYLAFEKYYYTPHDRPENILWGNIEYKLRVIYPLVYTTVNTDLSGLIGAWKPGYAGTFYPKWVDTVGEVKKYNATIGWYDPIPNALFAYVRPGPGGTYGGAYATLASMQRLPWSYTFSDETGKVFIPGLCQSERLGSYAIRAYVVDESTGKVTHAPGFGTYWYPGAAIDVSMHMGSGYGNDVIGVKTQTFGVYTLFKSATIILFDVGDVYARGAAIDREAAVVVNNFISHAQPEQWSWDCYIHGGFGLGVAALFVPPNEPIEVLLHTTYALVYPLLILTNSSEENPYGVGYTVNEGEQIALTYTSLRAGEEWLRLNEERKGILAAKGVAPPPEVVKTKQLISEAWKAINNHDYVRLEALQYRILALERDRYVALRATTEDTINAITFFGLVLVPFAFLFERLFGQETGLKRILILALCYGISLVLLSAFHPGFALASNSMMIVVGFLVLVLTFPLLGILYSALIDGIKRLRAKVLGVHWVEMTRSSVAMLGFSTGVLNMRRRRLRTSLTLLSVILVTTGVVMFTSMSAIKLLTVEGTQIKAPYNGILVRQWDYSYAGFGEYEGLGQSAPQLGERLLWELRARYGDKTILVPRSWAYTGQMLRGVYLTNEAGDVYYKVPIVAVLGLTPRERDITAPHGALIDGFWFTEDIEDAYVTVMGSSVANALNVTVGDKVQLSGYTFRVIGIADEKAFDSLLDLDGLEITPMDTRRPGFEGRLPLHEILVIPYKTVISGFKGLIVNAAIKFKPEYANESVILEAAKDIYRETKIPLYIGVGGKVYTISPRTVLTVAGWQTQSIPLAVAALVILNLMVGSIEERRRDIFTFSSVGLSPFHIGFLFLAESTTYAIVGGVIGYLLSMGFSLYGGAWVSLNYASTAVVWAVSLMMAVTIAVSFYPVYRASKLVTPSLERRWKILVPEGDEWAIVLPFSVVEDQEADGILAYIHELAMGHQLPDSEVFRTQAPIKYEEEKTPKQLVRSLVFDSSLTPYELGILQGTRFSDVKELEAERHSFQLYLVRKAGPAGSWMTFGMKFIDLMRKQVLLWRSFTEDERRRYAQRFREEILQS